MASPPESRLQAWRIVKRKYAANAFDGEGARIYGGRWNTAGTFPVAYSSDSLALAAFEVLVNLQDTGAIRDYVRIPVEFPPGAAMRLKEDLGVELPVGWNAPRPGTATRKIGDDWLAESRSLALRVPSAVLPESFNYLINPRHADFRHAKIGEAVPFTFDDRLFTAAG